ncbi:hypothetical protein C3L33_15348, partial [Rhododendron williamsianum]
MGPMSAPRAGLLRKPSDSGPVVNSHESESETDWEGLLKPFDLEKLRKSLNWITPFQLRKLLELPLDVPTSMEIFQWAGRGGWFKESLFMLIMKCYGRAGFPGQATRLLLDMRNVFSCEPTFKSYNVVLEVLVAGNCPQVAPNVFYEMLNKGISPTVYSFGVVMKALCLVNEMDTASNRVNEASKLLEEMFLMGCTPDVETFNDVIIGLCKVDRIHEAAKLVTECLSGASLRILLLMVNGRLDEAKEVLNESMLATGCRPDVYTYNILSNGKGATEDALKLVNDMLFRGCPLDEITSNGIIKALCNDGAVDKALGFFEEMIRKGLNPHVISCNILINGFCRIGKVQNSLDFLRDMIHRGLTPDIVTYNSLINGLCKMGHIGKL